MLIPQHGRQLTIDQLQQLFGTDDDWVDAIIAAAQRQGLECDRETAKKILENSQRKNRGRRG